MIYVSSDKTTVRYENGPTFFTAKMPTNSKKGYCGNCARRSKACSSHVLGPAPER